MNISGADFGFLLILLACIVEMIYKIHKGKSRDPNAENDKQVENFWDARRW
ncbi:MAG: hypothetical protein ACD_37C00596G0011 [uncultured bacterium]|nr:MAG: hypothetical protein ACD_37C00596G0011 [uncultured bacterium]